MKMISENHKIDTGLKAQALNNTNATGRYFSMKGMKKALFVLQGGAMAASKTTKIEVYEAKDASGTSAAAISNMAATITANTKVNEVTLTLTSVIATDAVTINGVTLTAIADGSEDYDEQTFSIKTTDATCAADLVKCINANVTGVTATSAEGVVTIKVTDPGEGYITASTEDATIVIATTQAVAYVEIDEEDLSALFTHVACKVTTTANSVVSVSLLREPDYVPPTQYVGASDASTAA